MLLIFHLLLLGQLSPGRCCLCPCLPSQDEPLAEQRERKAKGEEGEPSQEAPGPWPSLEPQPRVTEHLRSAGPAQPPCERIAQQPDRGGGIRRRRSLPPGVLCNQDLENSWKEEEECVLIVYMCFLTFRQIRSVVCVCVCLCFLSIIGGSCVRLRVVGVYPLLALSAQSGFRVGVFACE